MKESRWIGMDVGGTKTLVAVVSDSGRVLEFVELNTPKKNSELVAELVRLSRFFSDLFSIRGIGIAIAGNVDAANGTVENSFNLTGKKKLPIRSRVAKSSGLPVVIENDANAWAFSEAAHSRALHLAVLTLGTGLGCGLVLNGRVFHGKGFASQYCGAIVNPLHGRFDASGIRGTLESETNGDSVVFRAKKAGLKVKTASEVQKLAAHGNARAKRVFKETGFWVGIGIANLISTLHLERIVLAGGLSNSKELILKAKKTAREFAFPGLAKGVAIDSTRLGSFGAAIGAALLAKKTVNG